MREPCAKMTLKHDSKDKSILLYAGKFENRANRVWTGVFLVVEKVNPAKCFCCESISRRAENYAGRPRSGIIRRLNSDCAGDLMERRANRTGAIRSRNYVNLGPYPRVVPEISSITYSGWIALGSGSQIGFHPRGKYLERRLRLEEPGAPGSNHDCGRSRSGETRPSGLRSRARDGKSAEKPRTGARPSRSVPPQTGPNHSRCEYADHERAGGGEGDSGRRPHAKIVAFTMHESQQIKNEMEKDRRSGTSHEIRSADGPFGDDQVCPRKGLSARPIGEGYDSRRAKSSRSKAFGNSDASDGEIRSLRPSSPVESLIISTMRLERSLGWAELGASEVPPEAARPAISSRFAVTPNALPGSRANSFPMPAPQILETKVMDLNHVVSETHGHAA